jgi:hypothetical protein
LLGNEEDVRESINDSRWVSSEWVGKIGTVDLLVEVVCGEVREDFVG